MGLTQKQKSVDGFTLTKTDHSQRMKVPRHEHEHPYISLLLHGLYREESIISEHYIKTGISVFRPKGFEHKNEIGAHNSFCFNIEIEKDLPESRDYTSISDYVEFERNSIELFKIYFGFLNDYADELLALTVEENMHLLFQQCYAEGKLGRALWVEKILKEVRLSPERKYNINEVANELCLHPNYFVRQFKSKTGFTFGEFLLRQRISHAIDLMLSSSRPLTEIAIESGFYDQSHFIRHFRQFFGTSPSHYRQIVKG